MNPTLCDIIEKEIVVPSGAVALQGNAFIPREPRGVVIFAHGSGSNRNSPRNRYVAEQMQRRRLATVLFDLLSPEEAVLDDSTGELRFDIPLLTERLVAVTHWVERDPDMRGLGIGYFGASTGAAAALAAAAQVPEVQAIVSRGGRTDLAGDAIEDVGAAVLMIAGGADKPVIHWNRESMPLLPGVKHLEILPGASHLFVEPGALEMVARLAAEWFRVHLFSSWLP